MNKFSPTLIAALFHFEHSQADQWLNFSDTLYNIDHQYEQKGAIHLRRNTDLSKILEVSYQSSYQPHGRMCYQSKFNQL